VGFSLCKALLFILSYIIVDGQCKILYFFNLIIKLFFFADLILIEDQLILIYYEKIGLKEEEPK